MIAAAAVSGAAWTSAVAVAVVVLAALTALVLDRSRLRRRLAAAERSEALLETDLADARRELMALRECLHTRRGGAALGEVERLAPEDARRETAPGDPTTAVG